LRQQSTALHALRIGPIEFTSWFGGPPTADAASRTGD
jgi:hypothetical protein